MCQIQIPTIGSAYHIAALEPMTTAPKDGTPFLIWYGKGKRRKYPAVAQWSKVFQQFEFSGGTTVVLDLMAGWHPMPFLLPEKHQPKA